MKKSKQTADDLVRRYSTETVSLEVASAPVTKPRIPVSPLLDTLRRNIGRVVSLPIEALLIEENVRRSVDQKSHEFQALVDSVREHGIRQNIIVDLQESGETGFRVLVIAGQRRILAARAAGLKQVTALVLQLSNRGDRLAEGLAENLLREELHCLDQAEAYASLLEEGWTEAVLAEKFDRRRRTILQFIRLSKYPEGAKKIIRENQAVFTTFLLFNKFVAKKWKSDIELIRALKQVLEKKSTRSRAQQTTKEGEHLIRTVNRYNGLSCKVNGDANAGKIQISYKTHDALAKIIALFEQD